MKKYLILFLIITNVLTTQPIYSETVVNENSVDIQAVKTEQSSKYPDYAKMYLGNDKYEKFNRKMFCLNSKLNKYVAKPVHIIWSSIMPKFGIDRIRDVYNNIEYPKRLASCILQRDGQGIKQETIRFITNSTIGLGGLFDPADKIFKIKTTNENMEQALGKCKVKSGSYIVMPCLHSCTPRSMCGRVLEAALDPAVYIATPITSIIKFGLMVNRTSYMQPLANMIETTYADPYDIQKKLYGIENYIKNSNLDRKELLKEEKELVQEGKSELAEQIIENFNENNVNTDTLTSGNNTGISDLLPLTNALKADIILKEYEKQSPIVDSMKTALFEDKSINKSIWNELSIWNRCFAKRIKTGNVIITDNKEPYKFKYILQNDKNAPLVILYPSIGEGAGNNHSLVFAKMFYDRGYSIIMQGSHFHWEFVKSMPDNYAPGIPYKDAGYIKNVTYKILNYLNDKYEYKPNKKVLVGTSFGALATLFVAADENTNNTLNIDKFIAISPPIELRYALQQLDKNGEEFDKNSDEVKEKTALTAAKILQVYDLKDEKNFHINRLPFTDEEGKLITTFILRQKLSDIIFTLENINKNHKTDIYEYINNMSYQDYVEKYLGVSINNDEIFSASTLYYLSDYLKNNDNYKIYESFDDYFINKLQIKKLKELAGKKLICINCGSHLGFLYTDEFLSDFKNTVFESNNQS